MQAYFIPGSWEGVAGSERVYGSVRQAVLSGLQPNTVYTIRIEASNRVGIGEPSDTQTIKTLGEPPEGAPQEVTVKSLTSVSLKVLWKVQIKVWMLFSNKRSECRRINSYNLSRLPRNYSTRIFLAST